MKKSKNLLIDILRILTVTTLCLRIEAAGNIVYSDDKVTVFKSENQNEFHVKCKMLILDHYPTKPRIPIYKGGECELRASELIQKKIKNSERVLNRLVFPINPKNTELELRQFLDFYAKNLVAGVNLEEASDGDNLYGYLTIRYYFNMNDKKYVFQATVNGKSINKTETREKNLTNMRFTATKSIQLSIYSKPTPSN